MKRRLYRYQNVSHFLRWHLAGWRDRLAERRDARAFAEVREIVDTDEWLHAMAGGPSPRATSDARPTSKDGF